MTFPFVAAVRTAHDAALTAASWSCWVALAALLVPAVRTRAAAWTDVLDAADEARVRRVVLAAGAAAAVWLALLKTCQFYAFQLPLDTTILVNTAANLVRGRGLACSVDGTPNALTVHFAFFVPVFLSPLLLLARSALPFVIAQAVATASLGPAAFFIARRRTGSQSLGLLAAALTWSHVSFHQLATANLENAVFGPPLFLWGLVLWGSGRRGLGGLLWALALTTREQFPFTLAGLGLYHALRAEGRARRRWLGGAAVVLGAACVWALEMRLVGSFADSVNTRQYWALYGAFGGTRSQVVRTVLTRPDAVLARVLWPPAHLAPYAALLAGMAFLPLADPAAFLAVTVAAIHHLLQANYNFQVQNASYTFGPLVFASACGLAVTQRLPGGREWLLLPVLAAAGWGLHSAPRVIHPSLGASASRELPALLRLVPAGASVWADEYAAARLAARPQLKVLLQSDLPSRFDVLLFRPEYVLADEGTLLSLPAAVQARVMGFLAREGYARVAEAGPYILLRDPQAPRNGWSPALAFPDAASAAARVRPYLASLLDAPDKRVSLAAYPPDLRYVPSTAEEHAAFAKVLAERGLLAPAVAHGRAALSARPDFPEARTNLGNALAAAGDLAGAEAELRAALAMRPREALIAYDLGNVLIQRRKAEEAVSILEQAVGDKSGDARILNSLGAAYILVHRRAEARQAFERALAVDPNLAQARDNLAAANR